MALTVVVRSGDLVAPASITFDAPRVVIGRGSGCEVQLPDPSVSQRHASIRQRGTDYVIVDESSTNGTYVGPVRLSPQAPRVLRTGDLIRVGRVWLEVRVEQAPVTPNPKLATREIALSLVASALSADGAPARPEVRVKSGPDTAPVLVLMEPERPYVVGRGPGLDLAIDDPDLSRRHAELTRRGRDILVRDLRSKNGTYLRGERLAPDLDTVWPLDVPLVVGGTELVYDDPARRVLEELEAARDERMSLSEPIQPPVGVETPEPESPAPPDEEAPAAPPPKSVRPRSPRAFSGVDLLVALLALSVFGFCCVGRVLRFRV